MANKKAGEKEITVEERLFFLEEQSSYIVQLLESNHSAYMELIKSLNLIMSSSNRQQEEVRQWVDSVESRLGKLSFEQLNHSLIIGETVNLTVEQRKNIQRKIDEIKSMTAKELEDLDSKSNAPSNKPPMVVPQVEKRNESKEDAIRKIAEQVAEKQSRSTTQIPSENEKPLINKKSLRGPKGQ